ncbi:MAG: hypothetical protein H6667_22585 [Ardenticatenaceae bacterium]|nr:hypothetical protein [Ardenticatenaceae bacterium]
MKVKRSTIFIGLTAILLIVMLASMAVADDGVMFRRNVSKTPDQETERANLMQMTFYVPAQTSDGTLGIPIEYYDGTEETPVLLETRDYAKPLISIYIDALPEEEEELAGLSSIMSGAGFGAHDAYAAHSLDDGATWKRTNLSNSANLSSFILANGHEYPGDAHNMTFTIAGDKVLVGWISKYCDGGSPMYTFSDEDVLALQDAFGLPDLYVRDIWGVAGSQKSVDYTLQGFPEVGEIPYSCVWSARGQLLPVELDDAGTMGYDIIWTKAERLTSGRRDANRLEMNADGAAGFMMTWQEDPEGLRPGTGLGPGEGWSGAVVNQQTDLWYSFISIEDFVMVMSDDTDDATAVDIAEYVGETMPKVAVPMAMPIRLTDNKMCKSVGSDLYCYVDFDDENPWLTELPDEGWDDGSVDITQSVDSTLCTEVVSWLNPGGTTLNLCQTEDGRVLGGRVGASRPRVNVQPYNSLFIVNDVDDTTEYDSAIVIMGAEESKALGEGAPEDPGGGQPIEEEPEDVGKNMWYYSFDLRNPMFVQQGGMLNQPAIDPETGTFFEFLTDDFGNEFYETEISRRFSHFSQPIHQIGEAGVSAVLIVKQGIINQGGPADIFLRRIVVPDDVWEDCELDGDTETTEQCLPEGYNPYTYENMACDEWTYTDGSNPRYVEGLCLSNMINVSGGTVVACDSTSGEECVAAFPWDGQDDIGTDGFPKVTEWVQTEENLDDQSWENPYDVAKGHRGFIDGDFILMMYAWSPNWQANSVGNDHYNLYARRSFDGGLTWTTTPANLGGDGTETCENYKQADGTINTVCTTYGAGEFEQSRNLSQLVGNKETILDPRYTPTGGIKMLPITDLKEIGFAGYDDDERDPTKFFIVYETGDNTTVAEGEAVPLDLFYSRAINWGDDYDLVEYEKDGEITEGFDWLEHDREDLSGEAANLANNAGTFYYAIWNQWQEDEFENVSESDAIFRRIMYLDDTEADPSATILFISHTMADYDDELTFIGSARDGDHIDGLPLEDIDGYLWTDTIDGVTTEIGDQKQVNMPARNLAPGWHTISFSAKDKGGRWSPGATFEIWIVEELHQTYLPSVTN